MPGILSFMIPGLGHVYLGLWPVGILWFLPFLAVLAGGFSRLLLLAIAVASAWDAYRRKVPAGRGALRRRALFATVGIPGFLAWAVTLTPILVPLDAQLQAERRTDALARQVRQCRGELGRYPEGLSECGLHGEKDAWGTSFAYEVLRTGKGGFRLRSAGPDRQWGTRDDFAFRYR